METSKGGLRSPNKDNSYTNSKTDPTTQPFDFEKDPINPRVINLNDTPQLELYSDPVAIFSLSDTKQNQSISVNYRVKNDSKFAINEQHLQMLAKVHLPQLQQILNKTGFDFHSEEFHKFISEFVNSNINPFAKQSSIQLFALILFHLDARFNENPDCATRYFIRFLREHGANQNALDLINPELFENTLVEIKNNDSNGNTQDYSSPPCLFSSNLLPHNMDTTTTNSTALSKNNNENNDVDLLNIVIYKSFVYKEEKLIGKLGPGNKIIKSELGENELSTMNTAQVLKSLKKNNSNKEEAKEEEDLNKSEIIGFTKDFLIEDIQTDILYSSNMIEVIGAGEPAKSFQLHEMSSGELKLIINFANNITREIVLNLNNTHVTPQTDCHQLHITFDEQTSYQITLNPQNIQRNIQIFDRETNQGICIGNNPIQVPPNQKLERIVIGDAHANLTNILLSLINASVFHNLTDQEIQELVNTKINSIEDFHNFIERLEPYLNPDRNPDVELIFLGDYFSDRFPHDLHIMAIFTLFIKKGIKFINIASNHVDFCHRNFLMKCNLKEVLSRVNYNQCFNYTLFHPESIGLTIKKQELMHELHKNYIEHILPKTKLFHFDAQLKTLYSHAPLTPHDLALLQSHLNTDDLDELFNKLNLLHYLLVTKFSSIYTVNKYLSNLDDNDRLSQYILLHAVSCFQKAGFTDVDIKNIPTICSKLNDTLWNRYPNLIKKPDQAPQSDSKKANEKEIKNIITKDKLANINQNITNWTTGHDILSYDIKKELYREYNINYTSFDNLNNKFKGWENGLNMTQYKLTTVTA